MIDFTKFKLGARVLKTGLAVMIALYVSNFFELEPSLLAAIAAAISIQPSIMKTFNYLFEQMKANAIGLVMAFIALFTFGNEPWVVSIAIVLTILLNLGFKLKNTVIMSIVVVLAVMEAPATSDVEAVVFGLRRVGLILVGVASAMCVNFLIAPPKYESQLGKKIQRLNLRFHELIKLLSKKEIDRNFLSKEIKLLRSEVKELSRVFDLYIDDKKSSRFRKDYIAMKGVVADKTMYNLSKSNYKLLMHFFNLFNKNQLEKSKYYKEAYLLIDEVLERQNNIHYVYEGKIKISEKPHYLEEMNRKVFELTIKILNDEELGYAEKSDYLILLSILNNSLEYGENAEKMVWNFKKTKEKKEENKKAHKKKCFLKKKKKK